MQSHSTYLTPAIRASIEEVAHAVDVRDLEFAPLSLQTRSRSPNFQKTLKQASLYAPIDHHPILLVGETGSGKTELAKAIHSASARASLPLKKVNVGALSTTLALSELFGHERGAFTGATDRKIGAFEAAGAGSILLDELGFLSSDLQPAFLAVTDSGEFTRLGGTQVLESRARILAATSRDLDDQVSRGVFIRDLLARLEVLTIGVPSLADRREEIPLLAAQFLYREWAERPVGRRPPRLHCALLRALALAHWPMNLRDLRRAMILLYVHAEGACELTLDLCTDWLSFLAPESRRLCDYTLGELLELKKTHRNNVAEMGRALGVSRSAVHLRLKQLLAERDRSERRLPAT